MFSGLHRVTNLKNMRDEFIACTTIFKQIGYSTAGEAFVCNNFFRRNIHPHRKHVLVYFKQNH